MKCPFCGHTEDRVVDSRVGRDGEFIRRRRECLKCRRRYTTYEHIENVTLHVAKQDGRREEFDRQKLRTAILKACAKRPVSLPRIDEVVADIEARLHERAEKEITSREVGELDAWRSEEHTSELQSQSNLVCRLLLEKKKTK